MVRKMGFLGLASGALLALAACGPGGGGNADGGGGGGDGGGMMTAPPRTYTYVLNSLSVDMGDDPMVAHTGFNLDNLYSDGTQEADCAHEDFFSTLDRDQNCMGAMNGMCAAGAMNMGCMGGTAGCQGGVDNQLPTLANTIETVASTDVRAEVASALNNHQFSLLVRITDVNGDISPTLNDDSVTLKLYIAYPTYSNNCTSVTGGREFVIDQGSVMGSDIEAAVYSFPGSIVNGRIRVRAGAGGQPFNLQLPEVMGTRISLPLRNIELRASLNADGTAAGGNLGAFVAGSDVVNIVAMAAPMFRDQVETAISGLIDVQVMGVCYDRMSMPRRYGGIGVGLGFTTVPATVRAMNPVVMARPAGVCGSSSGGMM